MTDLLSAISAILPTYPFEAPQGANIPYCVYVKNETPTRTKDGICGYEGTLKISVLAGSLEAAHTLASRIIGAIDNASFDGRDYYYESSNEDDFSEIGLVQKDLIFNFIE